MQNKVIYKMRFVKLQNSYSYFIITKNKSSF